MEKTNQNGFTVTELFIVLAVLFIGGFFAHTQWQYFQLVERNSHRQQAVNAIYHYLEKVHYPQNNSYPTTLNPEAIQAISEDELKDPSGRSISDFRSDLRYEPGSCVEDACQRYTLRADLENAEDFIRSSND